MMENSVARKWNIVVRKQGMDTQRIKDVANVGGELDSNKGVITATRENNNGDVSTHRPYTPRSRTKRFSFGANLRRISERSEPDISEIAEYKDHQTEKNESGDIIDGLPTELDANGDVFDRTLSESDSSSVISTPCTPQTPRSLRFFSRLSSESLDDPNQSAAQTQGVHPRVTPSQDPDVMAARRSSFRNRRSGFAFQFGDQAVPANAFVNTEENPQGPKMLSVSEMMLKMNVDKKSLSQQEKASKMTPKEHESSHVVWNETCKKETADPKDDPGFLKGAQGPHRFSLIGLRKISTSEIEEELHFLHCHADRRLDLTPYEKFALLWYDKRGRFVAGIVIGIILAVIIRIILAIQCCLLGS